MNQRWKIIQIFINLTPENKVIALLLTIIFTSVSSNSVVAIHYERLLSKSDKEKEELRSDLKDSRSENAVIQEKRIEFMDKQLEIGYRHLYEIDSLKNIKK